MEEAIKNKNFGAGAARSSTQTPTLVSVPPPERNQPIPRYNGKHGPVKNLFKPNLIKEIGVPLFKSLCKKHSPQLYQTIKDLKEDEANKLVEIVRREDAPDPGDEFLNILPWIISLLDDEGIELLIDAGAKMSPDEHRGAFVARTWLEESDLFYAALMRRRSTNATSRKRYAMFRPSKPLNGMPFTRLDDMRAKVITTFCSQHFTEQRCGPTANVWLIDELGKVGLIVDRGSQKKSKGHIDADEKSITTILRDEKTDVAFLDQDSQTLWVAAAAARGMTEFYARLLGEHLYGHGDLFSQRVSFNLSFALSNDLTEKLANCTGGRIIAVRLKMRKINMNDDSGIDPIHRAHRGECLSLKTPLHSNQFPGATVASVKLEIEFLGMKPILEAVTITNNSVQSGLHLSDEELQGILSRLGILVGPANA